MRGIRRAFTVGITTAAITLASAVAATAPAQAAHTETAASTRTSAQTQWAPPYASYHNLTAKEHELRVTSLRAKGYRPITISISNDLQGRTLYAGTWSTSGKALGGDYPWALVYNVTSAEYQKRFDEYVARGYYPAVVSAYGFDDYTRIAAIFLKRPNHRFIARHNISGTELINLSNSARKQGLTLSSVDVYGPYNNRRYIAVWTPNTGNADWLVSVNLSGSQHNIQFNKLTKQGYRLTSVAVSASNRYTAVWRKDPNTAWYSYIGMDAATYQRRFNLLDARGFYPVHISAEVGHYAAIWTK